MRHGILQNLLARGKQQRTHHRTPLLRNARQATQPRTPQQVDKEGLDRVIGMVRHRNGRISLRDAQLLKPGIAQTTSCHLHRLARTLHLGLGIEAAVVVRHTILRRHTRYELLILIALGTAQTEIAMRHTDPIARLDKQRQHDHRIDTARDGQQQPILGRKELMLGNILLKTSLQRHHL